MGRTALVLGGGGVTGIAWELGMVLGLSELGVDLRTADLVVGTSAGSTVGAQILSGRAIDALYAAQLAGEGSELRPQAGSNVGFMARLAWTIVKTVGAGGSERVRLYGRRAGEYARRVRTVAPEVRRRVIESRLPSSGWPARSFLVTAVDADTGERVAFGGSDGVSLVDAVTASCAVPGVWPPVEIGERVFIDGGIHSPTNVDLAEGCDRLVVLAPIPRGALPGTRAEEEARALASRPEFMVVSPDRDAREGIGRDALDPRRRGEAARAGRAQAARTVETLAALWNR